MFSITSIFAQGDKVQETLIKMKTSEGTLILKLYDDVPEHKANFEKLVNEGVYDSLLFHRVIQGFMIQGGDPDSKNATPEQMLGNGDLGYKVPAEFRPNRIHKRGALAAARDGNPQKASSAIQFYIVQGLKYTEDQLETISQKSGVEYTDEQKEIYKTEGGTPFLDQEYTVFGELVEGFEVLDKIAGTPTGAADRPVDDVRILSAKVISTSK